VEEKAMGEVNLWIGLISLHGVKCTVHTRLSERQAHRRNVQSGVSCTVFTYQER
jgi:hypothetical protein